MTQSKKPRSTTKRAKAATATVHDLRSAHNTNAKNMEKIMTEKKAQYEKITRDAAATHKESADTMLQASTIAMQGMQDIFSTWMELAQNAAQRNAEGFKALVDCRTMTELTETQNNLAQQNMSEFVSGASRLSEIAVRVASDSFAPLNDRISRTMKSAA